MAVKIRLTRMGKKKQPSYRVVVMDSRKPRDGAYIEQIGRYDPREEPSIVEIDNDRALDWLNKGAQPTERVQKLLEISGAWTRFRVAKGDIHTVDVAPTPQPAAATAEQAPVVLEEIQAEAAEAAEQAPVVLEEIQAEAAEQAPVVLEEIQAEAAEAAEQAPVVLEEIQAEAAEADAPEGTEPNEETT